MTKKKQTKYKRFETVCVGSSQENALRDEVSKLKGRIVVVKGYHGEGILTPSSATFVVEIPLRNANKFSC